MEKNTYEDAVHLLVFFVWDWCDLIARSIAGHQLGLARNQQNNASLSRHSSSTTMTPLWQRRDELRRSLKRLASGGATQNAH